MPEKVDEHEVRGHCGGHAVSFEKVLAILSDHLVADRYDSGLSFSAGTVRIAFTPNNMNMRSTFLASQMNRGRKEMQVATARTQCLSDSESGTNQQQRQKTVSFGVRGVQSMRKLFFSNNFRRLYDFRRFEGSGTNQPMLTGFTFVEIAGCVGQVLGLGQPRNNICGDQSTHSAEPEEFDDSGHHCVDRSAGAQPVVDGWGVFDGEFETSEFTYTNLVPIQSATGSPVQEPTDPRNVCADCLR